MAKYFRITEIDATTFERMTGDELDCLQVAMLADDGNVYVAVDEDGHDCIDVDLEMFDDIGGGPLIEERIHDRCTALSVLEELDAAPTVDAVEVVRCKDCKHQCKILHAEGYWIYSCKGNSDPFVSHTVNGYDDEYCCYGERKKGENDDDHQRISGRSIADSADGQARGK